jgi:acetate kinase
MVLIFDPVFPYLRWAKIEGGGLSEGRCSLNGPWLDRLIPGRAEAVETIGYLLYHGGEIVREPAGLICAQSLKGIERCVKFLPEHNDLTLKTVKECMRRFPHARHVLLCDTAFFVDLPEEVSTYAVPYDLRKKGIRRYGGQGLSHRWAWDKAGVLSAGRGSRAVSVFMGNYTNMVAIKDGKPQETSTGFTQVEGIISTVSCGDIDPTVIFQLHSTGMSFEAINRLLCKESGFSALAGKKTELSGILGKKASSKEIALRRIYCYNILKYLGGFISSLGGIDSLIFSGEEAEQDIPFIRELCGGLGFLDLKLKRAGASGNGAVFELSEKGSAAGVFFLKYNRWEVLCDWIKEVS